MKKIWKTILSVLVITGALAAGYFAFTYYQENRAPVSDNQFDRLQVQMSDKTLQKTDIESLFYAEEEGLFYEWTGQSFAEYAQEVRSVSLELFGETLTFDLHLAQKDGVYFGFGRAEAVAKTYFVKAMNLPGCPFRTPAGVKTFDPQSALLLLTDSNTQQTIPQEARLYSEAFVYDLTKGAVVQELLDDRLRPTTQMGVKRSDYFIFTTELIQKSTAQRMLFFTRANYEQTEDAYRLYDLNGTETWFYAGYSPAPLLQDVILNYAYDTDGGIFHFKRGSADSFVSKIGTGAETDLTVASVQGDYVKDIVRQGDLIFNKAAMTQGQSLTVTNARTGEVRSYAFEHNYESIDCIKADTAGTKLAITGTFTWQGPRESYLFQLVTFVDLASGKVTQYAGSALYDAQRPQIQFSGSTAFLYCDGALSKFD